MHISEIYAAELNDRDDGYALWFPDGLDGKPPVDFTDVGFIRQGAFIRLFNAARKSDHPEQGPFPPPQHEPMPSDRMYFDPRQQVLTPGPHGSHSIQTKKISTGASA